MKSYGLILLALASAFQITAGATAGSSPIIKTNANIKAFADFMSSYKSFFAVQSKLQNAVYQPFTKVDIDKVKASIEKERKENKVLIYTYDLSVFAREALSILDRSGYPYKNIELGPQWLVLGAEAHQTRIELGKYAGGAFGTSIPKIFVGGELIGGCSELQTLVEEGKLDDVMKKANVKKKGAGMLDFLRRKNTTIDLEL